MDQDRRRLLQGLVFFPAAAAATDLKWIAHPDGAISLNLENPGATDWSGFGFEELLQNKRQVEKVIDGLNGCLKQKFAPFFRERHVSLFKDNPRLRNFCWKQFVAVHSDDGDEIKPFDPDDFYVNCCPYEEPHGKYVKTGVKMVKYNVGTEYEKEYEQSEGYFEYTPEQQVVQDRVQAWWDKYGEENWTPFCAEHHDSMHQKYLSGDFNDDSKSWNAEYRKLFDKPFPEEDKKLLKDVREFMKQFHPQDMEQIFGQGVMVRIDRQGVYLYEGGWDDSISFYPDQVMLWKDSSFTKLEKHEEAKKFPYCRY